MHLSGIFIYRRLQPFFLGLLVLIGAGRAWAEQGPSLTVTALLASFADMPGLEAHFREERHIALLEAPLVSEGTLHFAPPGQFLRLVTSPASSSVLIAEGQLNFSDGEQQSRISLNANPLVNQCVGSFVSFLAGDEPFLRQHYHLTLRQRPEAGRDAWELRLTPRIASLGRVLREVRLRGAGVVLTEMQILEVTGDRTVTTFSRVDPARRYTEAEQERLFRQ